MAKRRALMLPHHYKPYWKSVAFSKKEGYLGGDFHQRRNISMSWFNAVRGDGAQAQENCQLSVWTIQKIGGRSSSQPPILRGTKNNGYTKGTGYSDPQPIRSLRTADWWSDDLLMVIRC